MSLLKLLKCMYFMLVFIVFFSMKQKDKGLIEDEIFKLRAAIYSLRQRKQLSNTDQKLLADMGARLIELTRQSKEVK